MQTVGDMGSRRLTVELVGLSGVSVQINLLGSFVSVLEKILVLARIKMGFTQEVGGKEGLM